MLTIQNVYFVSFHSSSVQLVLNLANADVVAAISKQSDTFKVDVAPITILAESGGFTAVLTYKTVQINYPVASNLF